MSTTADVEVDLKLAMLGFDEAVCRIFAPLLPPGFSGTQLSHEVDRLIMADYWEEQGDYGKANLLRQWTGKHA